MKKLLFLTVSIALLAFTACKHIPTNDECVNYNDKIIKLQTNLINATNKLDRSLEGATVAETKQALVDAQDASKAAIEGMKEINDFFGYKDFQTGANGLFGIVDGLLKEEYVQLVDIYSLPADKITEEKNKEFLTVYDALDNKFNIAAKLFSDAQKAFASKYDMEIKTKSDKK